MTQRKPGPFRPIPLLNVEIDLDGDRRQVGRSPKRTYAEASNPQLGLIGT